MSDQFLSNLHHPSGNFNFGPGDQINFLLADVKRKPFRTFAPDHLLWLRRRFVPPRNFAQATQALASGGTVLLDGAPGTGRVAAALMLLHDRSVPGRDLREMPWNEEGEPFLAWEDIVDDDLLLLDLSTVDDARWTRARSELSTVRAQVHRHRAHLVVVLPHERAGQLDTGLRPCRVTIERPHEWEVLRRYLRLSGIDPDDTRRPSSAAAEFLRHRPAMEEIAQFAEFIAEARGRAGPRAGFADWCRTARTALSDQSAQVTSEVRKLDGQQRALLLATAMLHGAHADSVYQAAVALVRATGHPASDASALEQPGLDTRLAAIKATSDPDGRVRFHTLGYDAAVRRHFWTYMPQMREAVEGWVRDIATSTQFDQGVRDELVLRFTELCLRDRYLDVIARLAGQWTEGSLRGPGPRAAAQALVRGLADQRHGWYFRRQIYDWSLQRDVPAARAEVIIWICAEVMAEHHPHQAAVRLHHLARRDGGRTRARAVLVDLVRADRGLLHLMFHRLHDQFTGEVKYPADLDIFLELADPEPLTGAPGRAPIADHTLQDWLAVGWSVVYHRTPREVWRPPVERWLRAADDSQPYGDLLVKVLVEGGRQQPGVLATLYGMAGGLERSRPPRGAGHPRLRDRVLAAINIVQGVHVA